MTQIPVVAAVIRRKNKALLGRRPDHKRHGGLWEFPGGKIDEGETEVDAVTRELHEEFGVETTSVGRILYECRDPGSPFRIRFLDVGIRGESVPTEHTEIGWFEPDSLSTLGLAPCDARFVTEYFLRVSG
jgi:mutator protein MutT